MKLYNRIRHCIEVYDGVEVILSCIGGRVVKAHVAPLYPLEDAKKGFLLVEWEDGEFTRLVIRGLYVSFYTVRELVSALREAGDMGEAYVAVAELIARDKVRFTREPLLSSKLNVASEIEDGGFFYSIEPA